MSCLSGDGCHENTTGKASQHTVKPEGVVGRAGAGGGGKSKLASPTTLCMCVCVHFTVGWVWERGQSGESDR